MRALQIGEHSPITATGHGLDRKRLPRGKKAAQWRARSKYRDRDGSVKDVTRWAPTKDAAIQAVEEALEDRLAGVSVETPLRPGMAFTEAGAYWLTQLERPGYRGPTGKGCGEVSQAHYAAIYRRHIDVPDSPMRGLTLTQANDPQRLISFLQGVADKVGTQTAAHTRAVMSHILHLAMKRGVLPINAARQTGAIQAKEAKVSEYDRTRAMTREEREHVMATADRLAAEATHPRTKVKARTVADLIAFMAATGCRISEARMTTWDDLDLEKGPAHLRGTKNATSDRMVNLPDWLTARLKARKDREDFDGSAWAKVTEPYVFGHVAAEVVAEDGTRHLPGTNKPIDQSNLAHAIRDVLDLAGLPWAVPHSFRRTVASLLHEAGVPLVRIADQLGHADTTTTARVYLGRDFGGDKSDLAALL